MLNELLASRGEEYGRNGYLWPVAVLDPAEARQHRSMIDRAERMVGKLHYRDKAHLAFRSTFDLASHPGLLDAVEQCIGPDILLYNTNYIIKEPGSPSMVAWHQDLTYWGLADDDAQVSAWIAIEPATVEAGCMQMIPGSHRAGLVEHASVLGDSNLLLLGQRILDADVSGAVHCPLAPGEASLHHGWTIHSSAPNTSDHRRIGLNIQFLAPHNRHTSDGSLTATLVRGEDRFGNFGPEVLPDGDLEPTGLVRWRTYSEQQSASYQTAPEG